MRVLALPERVPARPPGAEEAVEVEAGVDERARPPARGHGQDDGGRGAGPDAAADRPDAHAEGREQEHDLQQRYFFSIYWIIVFCIYWLIGMFGLA